MGISMWYVIASLFLVLTNGEIYDNISKSFDDKSETSSPKPNQRLSAMEEYLLYLTPDQAQALQATGAIVRPLSQLENAFQQQRFQQSVKDRTEPHEQNISSNERFQLDKNVNEFYKELYHQQLIEALAIESQSTEKPTEKPARYKYLPKPHQEYASFYVQKNNNKTNSHSTEYVRYLPNYEIEVLKMKPYRAQPLPGFVDTLTNSKVQTYSHSGAEDNLKQVEFQKPEKVIKSVKLQLPEKNPEFVLIQRYEKIQKPVDIPKPFAIQAPVEVQSHEEIHRPIEFQIQETNQKPLEIHNHEFHGPFEAHKLEEIKKFLEIPDHDELQPSLGTQRHEEIKENEKNQRPKEIHPIIQLPKRTLTIERTQNQQPYKLVEISITNKGPVTFDDKTINPVNDQKSEKVKASLQISTPTLNEKQEKILPAGVVQRQYSSLLAPLVQHDKISESIAQQKDLINNERAIQTKLQQIKESDTHDDEKYAFELDKLKKNLGKQNVLAQKLATQSLSKKPQGLVKEELASQSRRPLELVHGLELSPVIIPRPYPVSWGIQHPIPVPVLQPKKGEDEKPVPTDVNDRISYPGSKNFYTTVNTPYLAKEGISGDVKHEISFAYRINEPENLTILRPIWEH